MHSGGHPLVHLRSQLPSNQCLVLKLINSSPQREHNRQVSAFARGRGYTATVRISNTVSASIHPNHTLHRQTLVCTKTQLNRTGLHPYKHSGHDLGKSTWKQCAWKGCSYGSLSHHLKGSCHFQMSKQRIKNHLPITTVNQPVHISPLIFLPG